MDDPKYRFDQERDVLDGQPPKVLSRSRSVLFMKSQLAR